MAIDGSLACQTNWDTAHPVLWSFSKSVTICFKDLDLTLPWFKPQTFRIRNECSNRVRHREEKMKKVLNTK